MQGLDREEMAVRTLWLMPLLLFAAPCVAGPTQQERIEHFWLFAHCRPMRLVVEIALGSPAFADLETPIRDAVESRMRAARLPHHPECAASCPVRRGRGVSGLGVQRQADVQEMALRSHRQRHVAGCHLDERVSAWPTAPTPKPSSRRSATTSTTSSRNTCGSISRRA